MFFLVHVKQQLLHLMLNFQSCERVSKRDLKNSFEARNLTRAFFQRFRGEPCPLQYDLNHRSVGSEILRILPYSSGDYWDYSFKSLQLVSCHWGLQQEMCSCQGCFLVFFFLNRGEQTIYGASNSSVWNWSFPVVSDWFRWACHWSYWGQEHVEHL